MMSRLAWLFSIFLWAFPVAVHAADAPVNSGPESIQVPQGFAVEIAAGPPLVAHPMMAAFDEQGRLFVAESAGKNLRSKQLEEELPNFVRMLEDTDGDGRFDRSTIFADRMTLPMGALWHRGALYVASPPNIWRLEDTDDDGVADRRDILVGTFGYNGNAASIHGCFLGPEGRIYWCDGRHGYEFRDAQGRPTSVGKAARIFSCKPDGTDVQSHCGGGMDNPVEIDFTPAGEMVGTVNLLYRQRGDCLVHWIRGGVYPRFDQADVIREFPRTGDLLPPIVNYGHVAVSGTARYRGEGFGPEFANAFFVTFFNTHRVVATKLERKGASFAASTQQFLSSTDRDFHPTDVLQDADGSLLVIDTGGWFRIGCPTSQIAKPNILGAIYRVRKEGTEVADPRGAQIDWAGTPTANLVGFLGDKRPAVRERTIEVIARRGAPAVETLNSLALAHFDPAVRRGGIWALARIDTPAARRAIRVVLLDEDPEVRLAACHAAGILRDPEAVGRLVGRLEDEHLEVAREAATALGQIGDAEAVESLLASAGRGSDRFFQHAVIYALIEIGDPEATRKGLENQNPEVQRAALIALDQMPGGKLARDMVAPLLSSGNVALQTEATRILSQHPDWASEALLVAERWLKAESPEQSRETILDTVAAFLHVPEVQQRIGKALTADEVGADKKAALLELIAGADVEERPSSWQAAVRAALSGKREELRHQAVGVAAAWQSKEFDDLLAALAKKETASPRVRVAALDVLAARGKPLGTAEFQFLLGQLSQDVAPLDRLAAAEVFAAARLEEPQLEALLPKLAAASSLEIRPLVAAFSGGDAQEWGRQLVAALSQAPGLPALDAGSLRDLLKRYQVAGSKDANALLTRLETDSVERRARLARLQKELGGGDAKRGRQVFFGRRASCSACHLVKGKGGKIGPDLSTVGSRRDRRDLLEAVLYPSASLSRGYESYTLATSSGRVVSGLIERETADRIEIRTADQRIQRIARDEIEQMRPSNISIMPQGLERTLSRDELRDLAAFLMSLKIPQTDKGTPPEP